MSLGNLVVGLSLEDVSLLLVGAGGLAVTGVASDALSEAALVSGVVVAASLVAVSTLLFFLHRLHLPIVMPGSLRLLHWLAS